MRGQDDTGLIRSLPDQRDPMRRLGRPVAEAQIDAARSGPQAPEDGAELRALTLVAAPEEEAPAVRHRRLSREESESDEQLARRGGAGVDALYRRHQGAVYRYCVGVMRSPEEAADASQSAWVRAFVALSTTGTTVLNVRPWLYAIARNECLGRLRARRDIETVDVSGLEVAGGVVPEEAHEAREELRALLSDLGALSERQRSAMLLREFCGLGADELAEALETTAPRALGLVADGRRRLLERRSGRLLACDHVRHELGRARRRAGNVGAHLEACRACQAFESRRRGHALSSRAMAPWALLPFLGKKMVAVGAAPAAVKGIVAASLVAGIVGLSPPVLPQAPSWGEGSAAPQQRLAEASETSASPAAREARSVRGRPAGSSPPTVTDAPSTTRSRTSRSAARAVRAPLPTASGTRQAPSPPAAAPGAPGHSRGSSGGEARHGLADATTTVSTITLGAVEQTTDDMPPAPGHATRGTLSAVEDAAGKLSALSR